MNILEYVKENHSIEEKQKECIKCFKFLDQESFNLFKEVLDLNNESYFKAESLIARCKKLTKMFCNLTDAITYMNDLESKNYESVSRRFLANGFAITISTVWISFFSLILGIINFIYLSLKANKQFAKDTGEIFNRLDYFDSNRIDLISRTLENSSRIIGGRIKKTVDYLESSNVSIAEKLTILESSEALKMYLDGKLSKEEVNMLDGSTKTYIINALKYDLGSDSNDLNELLDMLKNREDKNNKLLLEYS